MIDDIAPYVVTGLGTGSVYALAAMGLVLTFKTSGIFNFAHGALAAVGAYVMWELWAEQGWPWPLAAAAALLVAGVIGGLLLERVAYALGDKPTAMRVVATVGLLITLQGALVVRYGTATIPMAFFLPESTVSAFGVNIRYEQIIVFLVAAAAAVALTLFFRRARLGVAMQGVVDDPALLALQGTSPIGVRRRAWLIGSCFAAASGALLAPSLGLDATLLTLLVVQAFGAAAIGRFSSLPLTYVGGLVVGVGQELLKYLVSQDFLADHISVSVLQPLPSNLPFLVLFVVLLVTPRDRLVERGSRVVRRRVAVAPLSPRTRAIAGSVGAAVLLLVPHLVGTRLPLYTTALAFAILFASLHLLVRTSGQVSLCHMAFGAVGAAAFVHAREAGLPFAFALVAGGLAAVPVGAFIAIPAIRLSGVFLAIATFGFGILVERLAFPTFLLFGIEADLAAPRPSIATTDFAYYHVVLAVLAASIAVLLVVRGSRLGRLLRALADSPAAVAAHGASTNVVRTLAFCISAFLAGVGGAVIGPVTGTATPGTFNFGVSLTLLAVLLISGQRPVLAPIVAAAFLVVLPGYAGGQEYSPIVFGLAALAVTTGSTGIALRAWSRSRRANARLDAPSPAGVRLAHHGATA